MHFWLRVYSWLRGFFHRPEFFLSQLFSMPALAIGALNVRPEHLLALACALFASGGLWQLLYRTRFGLAVRAMTENRVGAACLGINIWCGCEFSL